MLDFRVGSDWFIFCWLNFEGCQINFLNFPKHPQFFYIWMILKEVMTKNQKNMKSENMPI